MSEDNPNKFFTAGEAAAIAKAERLQGVPTTKSGMIRWIKRSVGKDVEWLSRKRPGQKGGGGTEYSWCMFPVELMPALDAEMERRNAVAPWEPPVSDYERRRELQREHKRRRQLPPDLRAPSGIMADALAVTAGLGVDGIVFSPFLVRKVDRCRVRVGNRKFFSHDLAEHHQTEVCVTRCGQAPDLLWVLAYDKPLYQQPGPGRLICIADATAGIARYVSIEFQETAEAKREQGRKRRLAMYYDRLKF